ncbi:MaoC/PaaZ C-terminal domain-containing protein [Phyllobacterium sp. SB3]|uniref:MaoC family dehydratase n=1 Tax=Phyllobacterium sp. SB3 TaxID=3156073 RepID=UPI0032AFD21F
MQTENLICDPSLRLAPGQYYYDDVKPGNWYETPTITLQGEQIDAFAKMSGDFFVIHMDDSAAQELGFPRRIAHGLLVLALADGLKNQSETTFHAVASLGWNWTFLQPVFVADRLSVKIGLVEKLAPGKPQRGILRLALEVTNQAGSIVQSGTNKLMVLRR